MGKTAILDEEVTDAAAKEYLALTEEEVKALGQLYDVDDEMMNFWFGEGGEAFADMADIIEREFDNLTVFTDNVNNELEKVGTNFGSLDDDRSGSIEIDVKGN
jgi:uncharacterized protein YukE